MRGSEGAGATRRTPGRGGGVLGGHRLEKAARLDKAEVLVYVPRRPIGGVDVEDDEVAARQDVSGDGGGRGRREAAAAEVGVGEDVADDGDALARRVDVG